MKSKESKVINRHSYCLNPNKNGGESVLFTEKKRRKPLALAMGSFSADKVLSHINGTTKKHMIILTDGVSNHGIDPIDALKELTAVPSSNIYFIGLNTGSGAFYGIDKLSTVLEANNGKQLNQAFDKLLVEKILLEKEE